MKKLLLLIVLSFIGYSGNCQKKSKEERQRILDEKKALAHYNPRDSLNYNVEYCLLLAEGKMFSKEVTISIDYGQDATFFEDTSIRDFNGKRIPFNSVIDALNYMNSLGWTFVDAYAITVSGQNVYHYLLKNSGNAVIPGTKKTIKK